MYAPISNAMVATAAYSCDDKATCWTLDHEEEQ